MSPEMPANARRDRFSTLPALSENSLLRYCAFTALYIAQGIPNGFLMIAVPAWLVQQGLGAAGIGSYMAVVSLPWALKLIAGAVMDRFSFLPMGHAEGHGSWLRKRVWW
jgi:PAT family beta-lactamase induction signal transducer AmpG